jgi:hypothetical protein
MQKPQVSKIRDFVVPSAFIIMMKVKQPIVPPHNSAAPQG